MFLSDGSVFLILSGSPELVEAARSYGAYFGFEPSDPREDAFEFEFNRLGPSPRNVETELILDDWFGCRLTASGTRLFVDRGDCSLNLDKSVARVSIYVPVSFDREPLVSTPEFFLLMTFALVYVLQAHGKFVLHGAGIRKNGPDGILVLGDSDTGKSTLSLSMVRQGWGFLSDDSVTIQLTQGKVVAKPHRLDFGIDPHMQIHFPEIESESREWFLKGKKQRVNIRALYPQNGRSECVPRLLIFPMISHRPTSSFEPLRQSEALVGLMRQGSYLYSNSETGDLSQQMHVFGKLVRQCSSYRLNTGQDVMDNPEYVSDLLESLLDRHSAPRNSQTTTAER